MNRDRALTYSLLAHIRNQSTLVKGPLDIFVPLIKRVLSQMNNEGVFSGKSILEIKKIADKSYPLDFPIPVLEKILYQIAKEVNVDNVKYFVINNDKSFVINSYVFTEFEETIRVHKIKIEELESLFQDFCKSSGIEDPEERSIFRFIEKNKSSLSRYLANNTIENGNDYSVEAQFVEYFKNITPVYKQIKDIYLGSILSSYIEYKADNVQIDVELLFDTNFVVGLLDLNTPESTHTCAILLQIAQTQGYQCSILIDTIEEIKALLNAKARHFETNFLQRVIFPEDVYNACDRRGLTRTDLERISDNIEDEFPKNGISIITDTSEFQAIARASDDYIWLKTIRNSNKAALHDAIALSYVRKKRTSNFTEFDKVNCWFVNNAISREGHSNYVPSSRQPEIIKADDLVNILWLSNPQSRKDISGDELSDIGLASLLSLTLNDSLPTTKVISELDDNIHKYAKEELSDTDIIRVATRITSKQLRNIDELNELAQKDKEKFAQRLQQEAQKQKDIEDKRLKFIEKAIRDIGNKASLLDKEKEGYEESKVKLDDEISKLKSNNTSKEEKIISLEKNLLNEKNDKRKILRDKFYKDKMRKWRAFSWFECLFALAFIFAGFIYFFFKGNWNLSEVVLLVKEFKTDFWISLISTIFGFILTKICIPSLINKYRNHSNIENYKKGIELPDALKPLKELPLD